MKNTLDFFYDLGQCVGIAQILKQTDTPDKHYQSKVLTMIDILLSFDNQEYIEKVANEMQKSFDGNK